jgi:hypothetical protein
MRQKPATTHRQAKRQSTKPIRNSQRIAEPVGLANPAPFGASHRSQSLVMRITDKVLLFWEDVSAAILRFAPNGCNEEPGFGGPKASA